MTEALAKTIEENERFKVEMQAAIVIGKIIMSPNIGQAMGAFRNENKITQAQLAREMKMSSSVVNDYERSRRPSPGALFLKKYVLSIYRMIGYKV